jgi:hypothetical protein
MGGNSRTFFIAIPLIASLVATLFLSLYCKAAVIEVNVSKRLACEISALSYNATTDLVKFSVEQYNTGSVPYKARVRIDVMNSSSGGNEVLDSMWGEVAVLMPGDKSLSRIYYYSNSSGKSVIRVRSYYANEISERTFEISKPSYAKKVPASSDDAYVTGIRTYDGFLIADIHSTSNVKDAVVIPKDYPEGWTFLQKPLGDLKSGQDVTVRIPYEAQVFLPGRMAIEVVADEGTIRSEARFIMKKESGLVGFLEKIIDLVKVSILAP